MTVARQSVLEFAAFTTTSPATLAFTPAAAPQAVTCHIAHGTDTTDHITSVDYGGVAMARIATEADAAGEVGRVYTYFLGSGIPTGLQTVSIVHDGSATVKWAIVRSSTAAANTEVVVFNTLSGDTADPQIALDTGAASSLREAVIYSGANTPNDLAALAGCQAVGSGVSHDFGIFVAVLGQQTTAATGSFSIGWTALIEDVAMVAIAIQEVAAAGEDPYPYMGGGYYPIRGGG